MIVRAAVIAMLGGLVIFSLTRQPLPEVVTKVTQAETQKPSVTNDPYIWRLPEGWEPKPLSPMRVASFATPEGGDVGVFEFPGGVGGVVDNVNRWREQIGLAKAGDDEIMSAMGRTEAPVGSFMTCTLLGEDRLVLGAILALGDKSLVVTVKGPRSSLESVQGSFTAFLESIGPQK